ncbi:JAB domain-containing protein [Paenibacillus oryzisoli]|uniref:JAB domain-containing protein n=1 Tax=Paenibacillus oryzisoli TaxID=1850517 RepID=UPI003D2D6707
MQLTEAKEKITRMKRLDVVSLKLVKEASFPFETRTIKCPNDVMRLAKSFIGDADREICGLITLDTKNKVNAIHVVSIGSLNASLVHPREVFKLAILSSSASVVIFHNHPSGCPQSSTEDLMITNRLKEAGEILGIELLDHIIIGDSNFYSMKENGFI